MATRIASAARHAAIVSRISTQQPSARATILVPRRGLAGAAGNHTSTFLFSDHHGPPKVNCWQDPLSPSKWKEEHFVLVSLTSWGLIFYGGYTVFTRGKGKKEEKVAEAST